MAPRHIVVNEHSKRSTDIPGKTQPPFSISSLLYREAWVFPQQEYYQPHLLPPFTKLFKKFYQTF